MANNNAELKAFTGVHNETLEGGTHCVAPPSKEYKQLILEQLMKENSRAWEMAKGASSYGTNRKVIRERQKDFPWINHNMVNYFFKLLRLNSKTMFINNHQPTLPVSSQSQQVIPATFHISQVGVQSTMAS